MRGLPVKLKVKQGDGRRGTGREGREVRNKTENKRNVNERESDGRVRRGWGALCCLRVVPAIKVEN